jgi:hypothetical protein
MAESAAILRLTEYLNQTRRQAERSIDHLNQQLKELEEELENNKAVAEHLIGERDYYRNLSEQLKLENSKKWRLNERDDWKSLVESIQADRTALQEEVSRLEAELLNLQMNGNSTLAGGHDQKEYAAAGAGNDMNVSTTQDTKEAKLENELRAASKRIASLEHSLHIRATEGGISSASVRSQLSTALAAGRNRSDSMSSNQSDTSTTSSMSITAAVSMTGTGRSRAAARVVQQQRKIAAENSVNGSIWPFSMFHSTPKTAPHEEKTTTGVLFV